MAAVQEQTSSEQKDQVQADQAQTNQTQPQARPAKQKKRISARGFVNSPYLLALVPLIVGGFYLVNHPDLIQKGINNPYATAFVLAVPAAVFLIKLIINFFSVIEQWVRLQFEKARQSKQGHFFEVVTAVFMFVSVCEAGPFFNDIQHNVLYGALGYITVLAFDLIAVVCIDSRRKELAKGGSKSGVYLAGVFLCAAVSMVANLYSALQNFQAPAAQNFPDFLKEIAPYVGIMFPVMIVFLAFSRDTEIEIDDAEAYRKQQQKRVDFLAVRREILEKITSELERIDLLKQREFFLKSILFTKKKINYVIEVVTTKVTELVQSEIKTLKAEIEEKDRTITAQAQTITLQVQTVQTLAREMKQLATACETQCNQALDQLAHITRFREELQGSFDQTIAQIRHEMAQQNNGHQQAFTLRYDQDIVLVKQQLNSRIEQAFATINQQITERIEHGLAEVKTLIPPTYASSYSADNADSIDDINKVAIDYPIVLSWQSTGVKTLSIEEIIKGTNLSPQRVRKAEKEGVFSRTRREGYYRTGSVIEWLKSVPSPQKKERISQHNSGPLAEQNTDEMEAFSPDNHHNNHQDKGTESVLEMPVLSTVE
jgi:hypothetical protein